MAEELVDKAWDCELWTRDDQLVCVHRPRASTLSGMAIWFTFAGCAAVAGLGLAAQREPLAAITLGMLAIALFVLGYLSLSKDRAIRARPIAEMRHIVIQNGEVRFIDGTIVPAREVTLEIEVADYADTDRHELVLRGRDHSWVVMHAGKEAKLDTARELLRRAGLGIERYKHR